jgi:two-component system response regulator
MAEDDPDDRLLAAEALREGRGGGELRFVEDGEQLLDYLRRRGRWADPAQSPRPALVLLDLNMPRMDGREALAALKADPELRRIPVVVLTTSRARDDVAVSYDLGASSFITKPSTFGGLVKAMRALGDYWMDIVQLPPPGGGGQRE